MNIIRSFGQDGGHVSDHGLSPTGEVTKVRDYRHDVTMDLTRVELVADYALSERWSASLRVPYDVKVREAAVRLLDPDTPPGEVAEMEANLAIHHPSETLRGLSDPQVLLARRKNDVLTEGDTYVLAFGMSLPLGQIEEDPYVLGDLGLFHEHVQFGTGTFDPLLELSYSRPFTEETRLMLFGNARASLYENRKRYQGPPEISSGVFLGYNISEKLSMHAGYSAFVQGYAHWDGHRDVNSGLVSQGLSFGGKTELGGALALNLHLIFPIAQRTLSDEGDTFEQGVMLQISLSGLGDGIQL